MVAPAGRSGEADEPVEARDARTRAEAGAAVVQRRSATHGGRVAGAGSGRDAAGERPPRLDDSARAE